MGTIISGHAWANNEVAYVAWDIDGKIDHCLGFDLTRVYLNEDDSVVHLPDGSEDREKCAAWVAFEGQSNPNWLPQDTGVWPIQKLSWRDLTLRKKRSSMTRRPDEVCVRYEIRPVGDLAPGLEPVPSNGLEFGWVKKRDADGKPILKANGKFAWKKIKAYDGTPRPLAYLAPAFVTNSVRVTMKRGPFRSVFTNGILAAQWLRNVLNEDGVIEKNELLKKISNPEDPHRKYLAGDVIPLIQTLFKRPGEFYLSLYELDDQELVELLVANVTRIHIILSNSGKGADGKWDTRNADARERLISVGADIQHRMFNNSIHIGHNKFVVNVPPNNEARSVLTGSTNWTSTGVAGQTNNALLVEDDAIAGAFLDYWKRMKEDLLALPDPLSKTMNDNQQSKGFRESNQVASRILLVNGSELQAWFSPNMLARKKPASKKKSNLPPDLAEAYRLMSNAKQAILFLAFYPGQSGVDNIIGEAIKLGRKDPSLIVVGAVSSPQAMPNYVPKKRDGSGAVGEGASPTTFQDGNVTIVRASRIEDTGVIGDLGAEQLTPQGGIGAIIHDKLVVIDPRLPTCSVILGSHNLGFKASYSNDENMVIITGDQDLATAYAVHILDVFDHYRFRAIEVDLKRQGKETWSGYLEMDDNWQNGYVEGKKGALMRYFAR